MLHTEILRLFNHSLAGDMLTWKQLVPHLNWCIDEINIKMNTKFPLIDMDATEYTAFPDKYIRTVMVSGAVYRFYTVDEEGATTAVQFQADYETHMFYMLRDYAWQVPDEYLDDINNGSLESEYQDSHGKRGVFGFTFDPWG